MLDDLTAAEALIDATGAYALAQLSGEHGDWAVRTLGLLGEGRPASPSTLGWAAVWRYFDHDDAHALTLALRGIALADDDVEPAMLLCRGAAVQALRSSGDVDGARAMATALRVGAARCTDAFMRRSAYLTLIEHAFWSDLPDAPVLVAEFAAWAATVGEPSMSALAAYSTGRVMMWASEPADFDGAIRCYHEGAQLARVAGDVNAETLNLNGLAFAHTSVGSDDAPGSCRAALTQLRETGNTHRAFLLLDAVARWFMTEGAVEPAAVLAGYLDAQPATNDRDHDDVEQRMRTILERPDGQALLARGAGMSSDEAVTYTLSQLGDEPRRTSPVTTGS